MDAQTRAAIVAVDVVEHQVDLLVQVGPAGPPGAPGAVGPPGATGPAGLEGPQGIEGPQGSQGPPGQDGQDGAPGAQGLPGPEGQQGQPGQDGAVGPPGPAGPPGLDGQDGAQGPQGPSGQDGAQGPIGLTGPPGADGADGADGAAGPQGPGVATGGAVGDILFKTGAPDFATGWQAPVGPWQTPTFSPGSSDDPLARVQYRLEPGGVVRMRGIFIPNIGDGTARITGMPPGSSTQEFVSAVGLDPTAGPTAWMIRVQNDGQLAFLCIVPSDQTGGRVGLEGVTYTTA